MARDYKVTKEMAAGKGQKTGRSVVKDVTAECRRALGLKNSNLFFIAFDSSYAGTVSVDADGNESANITIGTTGKFPLILSEEDGIGIIAHAQKIRKARAVQTKANDFSL